MITTNKVLSSKYLNKSKFKQSIVTTVPQLTKEEIQDNKRIEIFRQIILMSSIYNATEQIEALWKTAVIQDKSTLTEIRRELLKSQKRLEQMVERNNVGKNTESYFAGMKESGTFMSRLVNIGLGCLPVNRSSLLTYVSKLCSWLNASHLGRKNDYLWINYGDESTTVLNVWEEQIEFVHKAKPKENERCLIATDEQGTLGFYDSKLEGWYDYYGNVIKATENSKWMSYDDLWKTL